ncbi:hypothetical protein I7I50_11057 [Histoplasma capsulatum G186AR]|uniref:Uncharacterized protein n=1 Tax=Ajellomyces capsulatus TaxID=5037 RepID=A0A8H8D7Q3_AJECA|nr:hypothetical protein I7I52_02296 [Histoplasma capsulatum]QSS69682.1 hypothetical protein I7I50_11057 [Histoplasma capsulatum G186AR]
MHPLEPFNPEYDAKEAGGCDSKITAVKHIHTVVYFARIPNSKHMQYVFSYQESVGFDRRISDEKRGWRGLLPLSSGRSTHYSLLMENTKLG